MYILLEASTLVGFHLFFYYIYFYYCLCLTSSGILNLNYTFQEIELLSLRSLQLSRFLLANSQTWYHVVVFTPFNFLVQNTLLSTSSLEDFEFFFRYSVINFYFLSAHHLATFEPPKPLIRIAWSTVRAVWDFSSSYELFSLY